MKRHWKRVGRGTGSAEPTSTSPRGLVTTTSIKTRRVTLLLVGLLFLVLQLALIMINASINGAALGGASSSHPGASGGSTTMVMGSYYHDFWDDLLQTSAPGLDWTTLFWQTRIAPLSPFRHLSFVHISKAAGASIIAEWNWLPNFEPQAIAGAEYSLNWQRHRLSTTTTTTPAMMASLKNPRHHQFSLYMECAHDGWGINVTQGWPGGFPRGDNDTLKIDQWLDVFVRRRRNDGDDGDSNQYKHSLSYEPLWRDQLNNSYDRCYHPCNFQSRHLDPHDHRQNVHFLPPPPPPISSSGNNQSRESPEPSFTGVLEQYRSLSFVAISDFYHASKCLLAHRLLAGIPKQKYSSSLLSSSSRWAWWTDKPPPPPVGAEGDVETIERKLRSFLETCHCGANATDRDQRITHYTTAPGGGRRRNTFRDLPAPVLAKMDALTRVDVRLYRVALVEFMKEVKWLERQLNTRVVCDGQLEHYEPEFAYMGFSVTELYRGSS